MLFVQEYSLQVEFILWPIFETHLTSYTGKLARKMNTFIYLFIYLFIYFLLGDINSYKYFLYISILFYSSKNAYVSFEKATCKQFRTLVLLKIKKQPKTSH